MQQPQRNAAIAKSETTYDQPGLRYKEGATSAERDALIAACREAARQHPKEPHFPFLLGLALRDGGQTSDAMEAFATARVLGAVGGYDEAAILLIFGNTLDPNAPALDGKAGIALLDEGIAKTNNSILKATKASALIRGPQEVRDIPAGTAILRDLVNRDDIQAMLMLADELFRHDDSETDRQEALSLYRKANNLGSGSAAQRLGNALLKSEPAAARKLLELAVERGRIQALNDLAFIYEAGKQVPRDIAKARDYYERAALRGNSLAQLRLGLLYRRGAGLAVDYPKALHWLELAAAKGNAEAMYEAGSMYDHAVSVPQDWGKARSLYARAAALGHGSAMNNVGFLFEYGRGATVDYAKAKEWYEKAITTGSSTAASNLAGMYKQGKGVPKDEKKALALMEQSASSGDAYGLNNLAFAYERGYVVREDTQKARELFRKAIAKGLIEARINLAHMLERGRGGPVDTKEAGELFRQAAEEGNPHGMYRYARRLFYDKAKAKYDTQLASYAMRLAYKEARAAGNVDVFKEIRTLLSGAVAGGDTNGISWLAEMTADGIGGSSDPKEARRLYQTAADSSQELKLDFARRLRDGRGLDADPVEARRLFTEIVVKDSEQSSTFIPKGRNSAALGELVRMMDLGQGGPKDPVGATELLRRQITAGHKDARCLLALRFLEGTNVDKDPAAARELLLAAKNVGENKRAYGLLGLMYERGLGGQADAKLAASLYETGQVIHDDLSITRLALLARHKQQGTEARRLFKLAQTIEDAEAEMAYVEMLDLGEGGPPEPETAAKVLLDAALLHRNPTAIALLRAPGTALTKATRNAIATQLKTMGLASRSANDKADALIGADLEKILKASPALGNWQ